MKLNQTLAITDDLYAYLFENSVREPDVLLRLREETAKVGELARMVTPPEQAQFLAFLVELIGAKRIIEVGVFTGYSTLAMARGLQPGGKILACDVSEEWTATARRFWEEAGVTNQIELRLHPAADTLKVLLSQGQMGSYDMIYVDADKHNYDNYYELGLQLLRPGGLIAFDNTLWGGSVADPMVNDEDTVAIRTLNAKLKTDKRVSISMLPIGDGLSLVRKS